MRRSTSVCGRKREWLWVETRLDKINIYLNIAMRSANQHAMPLLCEADFIFTYFLF